MGASDEVLAGKRDRYTIDKELGRGGFGVTHLARRERDGAAVVVKRLRMDRLDDWKAFDLFEREAKVLRALRHPSIPAFVDHFEIKVGGKLEGFALVQEYVEGRTLRELQQARTLDVAAMRRWFTRLLEICRYLHEQDPPVIHRDINPKNVLVRADGEPVLIDFGTVQNALRSADTVSSTSAGTFGYAASEQLIGRALPSSDLFGLAMTYVAVASGKEPEALPFAGNRVQISEALRGHDAHPRLKLLLEEMTDPDPAKRPASAGDVLSRVQAIPAAAATPSVALVPADTGDPAAQIERTWRERAERTREVGRGAISPKRARELASVSAAAIDETGTHALICFRSANVVVVRLDLQTLEWRTLDVGDPGVSTDYGVASDGRSALIKRFGDGVLVTCEADGASVTRELTGLPSGPQFGHIGSYAISPDRTHLAVLDGGHLVLHDLARGGIAQKLELKASRYRSFGLTLSFVPDGTAMLLRTRYDAELVDAAGTSEPVTWTAAAFAGDGHKLATAQEARVSIGVADQYAPLRWRRAPAVVWTAAAKVVALRWSPDDRLLAAVLDSNRVVVIDATSGDVVMEVDDPYRPGAAFERIEHVGFSADSRRLLVFGHCTVHPLATDRDGAIAVYSLTQRRPLGTIVAEPTEFSPFERSQKPVTLLAFTPFGHAGKLGGRMRGIFTDQPVAVVLGDTAAGCLDLEDRVRHWGGLVAAGKLPADLDLLPLVEASAGLTHLLPLAVDRASAPPATGKPARFGQSAAGSATMPVPALLEQLRWLAGKDDNERDVLFAEMLPSVIARELAARPKPAATGVPWKLVGAILLAVAIFALLVALTRS